MLAKIALDLFNLALTGLVLWGFGSLCWACAQSTPKPQAIRKRRRR